MNLYKIVNKSIFLQELKHVNTIIGVNMKYIFKLFVVAYLFTLLSACTMDNSDIDFASELPKKVTRTWIGPEYWANPLQDWQLSNGRMECVVSGGDRSIFLLTHEMASNSGSFKMKVKLGKLINSNDTLSEGWVGFKIGIKGEFNDYRSAAVRGYGFPIGITTSGQLFIGKKPAIENKIITTFDELSLELKSTPKGDNNLISLIAYDSRGKILSQIERDNVNPIWLSGGIALTCSNGEVKDALDGVPISDYPAWGFRPGTGRGGNIKFWFSDWSISGSKIIKNDDRIFGPILFAQYTLSKNILKMTAQLPPIGKEDGEYVQFQIKESGKWNTIQKTMIDALARTVRFKVENWNTQKDIPYRLVYKLVSGNDKLKDYHYEGTIRKEPLDKKELVVAAFTGNNDLGFPNNDIFNSVKKHNPDVMFFSGDQIYEGVGGYGVQRSPIDKSIIDYLRKWYLYGWAYGDLMRDRPTIAIPDDHDVYHGNIWGEAGKAVPSGTFGKEAQDAGGYKMPAEWVIMVERTQTSHLPDPYDSTPVKQGIGVYYTSMNYAGVSFAIIEDRKFKSAPKPLMPKAKVNNGWAQNKKWNAEREGDVAGAILLGKRQLEFLDNWASDWADKTWMKVVLSQTIFANVATLPREKSGHDSVVPSLKIFSKGEYPPDDVPVKDMDSNGWPQTPRNKAVSIIRKAFAFHIAGDQHLGSTIQYGVDDWNDAGYAFCVPSISNVWPRRWFPNSPGKNRKENSPKYTGDFKDGFGNKMTVSAVSNPIFTGKKPARLYDRATGYGIVRFKKDNRDIEIECWPRLSDPSTDKQYAGWPIKINQNENYERKAVAYLPTLKINGMTNPVVQIINESKNEIIYTLRINGSSFTPKVFELGNYTIKVGELETDKVKVMKKVASVSNAGKEIIEINL